jgi:hypothetical protein
LEKKISLKIRKRAGKERMINFKGISEEKMSKTQNSLRFKLRYPSHLCLLSVNPPSALSL